MYRPKINSQWCPDKSKTEPTPESVRPQTAGFVCRDGSRAFGMYANPEYTEGHETWMRGCDAFVMEYYTHLLGDNEKNRMALPQVVQAAYNLNTEKSPVVFKYGRIWERSTGPDGIVWVDITDSVMMNVQDVKKSRQNQWAVKKEDALARSEEPPKPLSEASV